MDLKPAGRVVIADDFAPGRAAARGALERGGFVVCAEAHEADGAVQAVLEERPDVLLLDIRMPGGGIRAAREISLRAPEVAIVMLTVSQEDDDLYDALCAGASGYLVKGGHPDRLPEALRAVVSGEAILPMALVRRMVDDFQGRERRLLAAPGGRARDLTAREWDVLELLADGHDTAEIAERLFIAKVTVRSHVAAILRKLRVRDRPAAIALLRTRWRR